MLLPKMEKQNNTTEKIKGNSTPLEMNTSPPLTMASQPTIANSQDCTRERGLNWLENETLLLLEGKKRFAEEMQNGSLMKTVKSKLQRWEYVSAYLADMGVIKSPLQCDYRWTRIWKPFKIIFNYQKSIPSERDSYWSMSAAERLAKKLPRFFDAKIYTAMKEKFGGDRASSPKDVFIDSSSASLSGKLESRTPIKVEDDVEHPSMSENADDDSSDFLEVPLAEIKDQFSGKKRKRPARVFKVKKDFEDTTKQLIDIFGNAEKERTQSQRDFVEISRQQCETTVKLQQEHIAAVRHSTEALMEIVGAIKMFTSGFGSHS